MTRELGASPLPFAAPKSRRPVLSATAEVRLAKRVRLGDLRAKQEMTERNLGLVFAVARPYRACGVPFADLVQEGTVGLIRAVERFDHRRGLKFSTYAVWWIRRSMLDAIGSARTIRIPAQAAQQLAAVRRAEAELARLGLGPASDGAIAEHTGLSTVSVQALRNAGRVTASLDESIGDDGMPLGELIQDSNAVGPEEQLVEGETRKEAWALMQVLPQRHREVLLRRYGLGARRPQSHQEIGEVLGVKEERSRQLEREALHRLREYAAPSQRAA